MFRAITKKGSNLSPARDNRPRKNSGAIVSGIKKVMVPTGRLELPRIAPLAPQASVSTNSTTSALSRNFRASRDPVPAAAPESARHSRPAPDADRRHHGRRCRGRRSRGTLLRLVDQRLRGRCLHLALKHVGEAEAVDHEDRREDRGHARQTRGGATRAEHRARRARAKAGTGISALASLQENQAHDREGRNHLHYCENRSQHLPCPFSASTARGGDDGDEIFGLQ